MVCYLYLSFQIKQEYSRIQGAGQPEKGIAIIRKILEGATKPDLGEQINDFVICCEPVLMFDVLYGFSKC